MYNSNKFHVYFIIIHYSIAFPPLPLNIYIKWTQNVSHFCCLITFTQQKATKKEPKNEKKKEGTLNP